MAVVGRTRRRDWGNLGDRGGRPGGHNGCRVVEDEVGGGFDGVRSAEAGVVAGEEDEMRRFGELLDMNEWMCWDYPEYIIGKKKKKEIPRTWCHL